MTTIDLVVQPVVTPAASRAADRALMARAVETGRGALRVFAHGGDVVSLGRYHREPAGAATIEVARRLTGGRPVASGDGFAGMSLVLPHRSALVGDDPLALAPEQVMNRCVRGLLGALEAAGVPALYPGRDLVTSARRPIATLALEVDARGATLFEAVVSLERDQAALPGLLDRVDAAGVVPVALLQADDVTSVGAVLGRVPAIHELAGWLQRGFAQRLGVTVGADDVVLPAGDPTPVAAPPTAACDRSARTATMLGSLEVFVALDRARLAAAAVCGDVLAPSWAIARLEAALVGCRATQADVAAVVEASFAMPGAFLLGIGPLDRLTTTILRAAGS